MYSRASRKKPRNGLPPWVSSAICLFRAKSANGATAANGRPAGDSHDDIRTRHSAGAAASPKPAAVSRYMVLRGESTPAVIPDEQMAQFRFMLDYSPEAVEMCSVPLAPGDAVKVIKGPLGRP